MTRILHPVDIDPQSQIGAIAAETEALRFSLAFGPQIRNQVLVSGYRFGDPNQTPLGCVPENCNFRACGGTEPSKSSREAAACVSPGRKPWVGERLT